MRRVILAIVTTAVVLVLLLSFKSHTGTSALVPAAVGPSPDSGTLNTVIPVVPSASAPASASASTPSATSKASGTPGSAGTSAKTVTGDAVQTVYGPVQVRITVADGKVTAAQAIEYPEGTPRDQQINAYAIPLLQQETIGVTSPEIDAVSGATYTSEGYIGSLQSALDKAGV
jgi:uncharacterized protein with FMN-binding domain